MKRLSILLTSIVLFAACSDYIPFDEPDVRFIEDNVLAPCRMTRAEAMNLILSQGIGYGYNGVDGEECNVPDVRSQVLEPNAILNENITAFFNEICDDGTHFQSTTGFSLNELLEKVYFGGGASAELAVVFKGSVRGTLQLYSHKKNNSYYCNARAYTNAFQSFIDGPSVSAVVRDNPELLTRNFRSAIKRLGSDPTKMQMDSLIARYGTHVVTKCTLGGIMELNVRLEKDSIVTMSRQNALGEVALMSLFKHDGQSSDDEYDLKIINSGDSRLTVRGGDSRKLEQIVMNFDWGRESVKSEDIDEWLYSIRSDNGYSQSLEMTSMEMMPIWEFIPDEHVARKLEAHITGDAQLMLDLYGYQNFVNTSFPACPAEPQTENWHFTDKQNRIVQTSLRSMCYNIEAGGRYVATLCYEQIPEIDQNEPVWVAYPIYQQQVNISTGLCIHKGKAYRVGWQFGEMVVTPVNADDISDRIYMTGGYLYPMPTRGFDYEQSRVVTGYEWPGGIKTDGTLGIDRPFFTTYKENDLFLLRDMDGMEQQGSLSALPNWTFNSSLNRMVRDDNYSYYYNPREINYLQSLPQIYPDEIRIKTSGSLTGKTTRPVIIVNGTDLTLRNAETGKIKANVSDITLRLDNATIHGQIDCKGSATICLERRSVNSISANESGLSAVRCASGQLKIQGNGQMIATGGEGAAGIGSNRNESQNNSNIIIECNAVTAYGGKGGAGIGSGSGGSCGKITVNDTNVGAYSSGGGAGIGSGKSGKCNDITIRESYVVIEAKDGGAGIGTGSDGSSCGEIRVFDSYGYIQASDEAAGIGSGYKNCSCKDIIIESMYIGIDAGTYMGAGKESESGIVWETLGPPL